MDVTYVLSLIIAAVSLRTLYLLYSKALLEVILISKGNFRDKG